jgi:hypothetical protein
MTTLRSIPLNVHVAAEATAAPLVMTAPFVLGFGPGLTILTFAVGAVLLALALAANTEPRLIPLADHALADYAFAFACIVIGLAVALSTTEGAAAVFLVLLGGAHGALAASTRFSAAPHT